LSGTKKGIPQGTIKKGVKLPSDIILQLVNWRDELVPTINESSITS